MEDEKESETEKSSSSNQIKLIVLGEMAVGKTCLINHYKTGKFLQEIPSTNGCSYVQKKININEKKYILNLWDTAGQEKYQSLTKMFIKNAKIIILVYSIIDKRSFQKLNDWLKLAKEINGDDGYALGVAANKSDLYKQSVVPDSQGQDFAKKNKAIWKSTSAIEDDKCFEQLIEELVNIYLEKKSNSDNPEYIKLNNKIKKKKEGGCCRGKGSIQKNSNVFEDGKVGRDNRINSKTSNLSVDSNKDEDEDY